MSPARGVRFIRSLPVHLPRPNVECVRGNERTRPAVRCDSAEIAAAIEGAFDAGPIHTQRLLRVALENSAGPSVRRAIWNLPDKLYADERELWRDLARNDGDPTTPHDHEG